MQSVIHSSFTGRNLPSHLNVKAHEHAAMQALGVNVNKYLSAMDSLQPSVTTGSMTTPVQFLQAWYPGLVRVITAARKGDDIAGITTLGAFEDEEVVVTIQELLNKALPYGDLTNIPLATWNVNFIKRTIVRFEQGLEVGVLEELRAARMNVSSSTSKRDSAALALEVQRNLIAFYGFNSLLNATYGILNDPNLPSYVPVSTGTSGDTQWSTKTFLEITGDIRTMVATLRQQSKDRADPEKMDQTLVLPTSVVDYLTTVTDFGISVRDWMTQTYPKIRVVSAPEFEDASGGENVAYFFLDSEMNLNADDMVGASTDDKKVIDQAVPSKFFTLAIAQSVKGYEESYANATAGVVVKRPWGVTRWIGV